MPPKEINLPDLSEEPRLFRDCCCSLSTPLIETLMESLPSRPALVFSIGSGTGLLEELLRRAGLNIYGVEVPSCQNVYLPDERMLRVATSLDVHSDAILAEALIFCYPRTLQLVDKYLRACVAGALETVVFLSHRDEWPAFRRLFLTFFASSNLTTNSPDQLPGYEVLCIASHPLPRRGSTDPSEHRNA